MPEELKRGLPLLRKGPRITVAVDFNLQWLKPEFAGSLGMYYFHVGWFSGFIGVGKARDIFWDALDRGALERGTVLEENERLREQVEELSPKIVRVQRSYMRDNHTFLMLSENDEEAIAQLGKEYAAGNNWGLLSVTVHLSNGKEGSRSGYDIVPGTETWATFKPIAESWLKRSHIGKEPADGQ